MTVNGVIDLDLSDTPRWAAPGDPLGSPWEAARMGAQAWVCDTQRH